MRRQSHRKFIKLARVIQIEVDIDGICIEGYYPNSLTQVYVLKNCAIIE